MLIKKEKRGPILITVYTEPEEIPIRGNAISSGDTEFDRQAEDDIIKRYNAGDELAWCQVRVEAEARGFKHIEYLGACSFESQNDIATDEILPDMANEAVNGLKKDLQEIAEKGRKVANEADQTIQEIVAAGM